MHQQIKHDTDNQQNYTLYKIIFHILIDGLYN